MTGQTLCEFCEWIPTVICWSFKLSNAALEMKADALKIELEHAWRRVNP